jgi:hypothetical protein
MDPTEAIHSQYHAALQMLKEAIIACPDSLWDAPEPPNRFWQLAFHTLFYTHLYLQDSESNFQRWSKHRPGAEELGHISPQQAELLEVAPYSKGEILEYLALCNEEVVTQVKPQRLDVPSGFDWLPFSKFDCHLYTIRHIQQHVGELYERLGTHAGIYVGWVGRGQQVPD